MEQELKRIVTSRLKQILGKEIEEAMEKIKRFEGRLGRLDKDKESLRSFIEEERAYLDECELALTALNERENN